MLESLVFDELVDHDLASDDGVLYARRYVAWMCNQGRSPLRAAGLSHHAAAAIRELVRDVCALHVGRSRARRMAAA